jgi:hypothetical protein
MAQPTGSSSPHPRWGESASPDEFDPGTDPGRAHPYESLYRGYESGLPEGVRPTPRHYIPSVTRPDGAEAGYDWLFRDATPPGPTAASAPAPLASRPPRWHQRPAVVITAVLLLSLAIGIAVALLVS